MKEIWFGSHWVPVCVRETLEWKMGRIIPNNRAKNDKDIVVERVFFGLCIGCHISSLHKGFTTTHRV